MRVNLISDLHLEFGDLVLPGGDVLILGGDIVEAKHLTQSKYVRFFNEECSKYREVIYVTFLNSYNSIISHSKHCSTCTILNNQRTC